VLAFAFLFVAFVRLVEQNEPFAVINADDFYGYDAFKKASNFLESECAADRYAILGYDLLKTLSDNGTVNRGICQVDKEGNLTSIAERINVSMKHGKVVCDDNKEPKELPLNTSVSMNFWCFHPSIFDKVLTLSGTIFILYMKAKSP